MNQLNILGRGLDTFLRWGGELLSAPLQGFKINNIVNKEGAEHLAAPFLCSR